MIAGAKTEGLRAARKQGGGLVHVYDKERKAVRAVYAVDAAELIQVGAARLASAQEMGEAMATHQEESAYPDEPVGTGEAIASGALQAGQAQGELTREDLESMPWGELKTIAAKAGVFAPDKKKDQLVADLVGFIPDDEDEG